MRTNREAKAEILRIVARLRELAPALRGEGMTASDASFNRTLRHADALERIAKDQAERT